MSPHGTSVISESPVKFHSLETDAQTLSCFEYSGCTCAALSGSHVTLFHFNNLLSSYKGKESPRTGLKSQMLYFLTNDVSTIPIDSVLHKSGALFSAGLHSHLPLFVDVKHLFCAVSVLGLMLSFNAPSKSCKISVSDSN